MFALLGNFNRHRPDRYHHTHTQKGGEGGGGQTLVSSTGQSASAIYLTTLATPALLLREAGAEALRNALGLSQGAPSPSPSPSSSAVLPRDKGSANWARSLSFLNELLEDGQLSLEEEEEEEEEEDDDDKEGLGPRRYRPPSRRASGIPCDCKDFAHEEMIRVAI
ncbi:hypothetical protein AGOR_G00137140 [Albula goreensis]|uniref:Uncharacterized protein n=1 Tax=Albula goreensis TaxID=1534307 RepID=A0A8T3D5C3_9TELE|nr:hypothetical protein AGOR_G00137140 [Albula goreensis]